MLNRGWGRSAINRGLLIRGGGFIRPRVLIMGAL